MWILEGTWPEVPATSEALAEPAQKCEALWALLHGSLSARRATEWAGGYFTPTCPFPLCLPPFKKGNLEPRRNAAPGKPSP